MLNLNSEIDVSQFFSWWGKELSSFLPKPFRKALTSGRGLFVVDVGAKKVKINYFNQGQQGFVGEFEPNIMATDELQNLIKNDVRYKDAEYVLRIPEHLSIKKEVFLPLAAEANLRQALSYELDRYTPFNKDQVYFDFIKLEQKKTSGHIHILLVLVKKATLDEMYQVCLNIGLKPHFADSAIQPVVVADKSSRYNLLPSQLCQKANRTPLYIMFGALLLTLVLLGILLIYPLYKLDNGLVKLKQHKQLVEKAATQIDKSKKGIDYLYKATQTVIDKKKEHPSMIDVINTASKVLNDDTWVSQFRYSRKNLKLTGQSFSASSLIASLEEADIFHNVKFISPVTKDNRTGMERFRISTEVSREKMDADAE